MMRRSILLTVIAGALLLLLAVPGPRSAGVAAAAEDAFCPEATEAAAGDQIPAATSEPERACTENFCALREEICESICECPRGDGVKDFDCETINNRCVVRCRCFPPTSCPL